MALLSHQLDKFDWVTAHEECALPAVFQRLFDGAKRDVDMRNSQFNPMVAQMEFRISGSVGLGTFTVSRESRHRADVIFALTDDAITIARDGMKDTTVRSALSEFGQCNLLIGNDHAPLMEWELRRLVLEDLFFQLSPKPAVTPTYRIRGL